MFVFVLVSVLVCSSARLLIRVLACSVVACLLACFFGNSYLIAFTCSIVWLVARCVLVCLLDG